MLRCRAPSAGSSRWRGSASGAAASRSFARRSSSHRSVRPLLASMSVSRSTIRDIMAVRGDLRIADPLQPDEILGGERRRMRLAGGALLLTAAATPSQQRGDASMKRSSNEKDRRAF